MKNYANLIKAIKKGEFLTDKELRFIAKTDRKYIKKCEAEVDRLKNEIKTFTNSELKSMWMNGEVIDNATFWIEEA